MKTLPECNDEAARKIGYKDMDEVFSLLGNHSIKDARHSQLFVVLSEAAELYTSQFREPSTEQSGGTEQEIERLKETLSSYRMLLKELWFQNKTRATVSETFLQTIDKALHP